LISGHRAGGSSDSSPSGDPSLIPQLQGKLMLFSDFTGIISMQEQARMDIFKTLRECFDGRTSKDFGNGVKREYVCDFGLLAGVTDVVEKVLMEQGELGERFVRYHFRPMSVEKQKAAALKAIRNTKHLTQLQEELGERIGEVMDTEVREVEIPGEVMVQIVEWSSAACLASGAVSRDRYHGELHICPPVVANPTRMAQQLGNLAQGVAIYYGSKRVGEKELEVVKEVALGSVPSLRRHILEKILRAGSATQTTLATGLPVSRPTGVRVVEDLLTLKCLVVQKPDNSMLRDLRVAGWYKASRHVVSLFGNGVHPPRGGANRNL